jgi:hypothetical protein
MSLAVGFIRCTMKIQRAIASVVLATSLAGCGAVDLISSGLKYAKAVETDLQRATGVKPEVGFNWRNGSLRSVTVTFPRVYAGKPLDELAGMVREVVAKDFKQTPGTIVLAIEEVAVHLRPLMIQGWRTRRLFNQELAPGFSMSCHR